MNTACAVLRFCPNLPEEFFRVRQFLCVFFARSIVPVSAENAAPLPTTDPKLHWTPCVLQADVSFRPHSGSSVRLHPSS